MALPLFSHLLFFLFASIAKNLIQVSSGGTDARPSLIAHARLTLVL
jgi:hypothetical protein